MNELVQRLSEGEHPVTVGGPQPSLEKFRKHVEQMEYIFIKYTGTRGETDLGVRVDQDATHLMSTPFW